MTKAKELKKLMRQLKQAAYVPLNVSLKFAKRANQVIITASAPGLKHPLNTYITLDSFLHAFQIKQKGYVIALLPALGSCELYQTSTILKIATRDSLLDPDVAR